MTDDHQEKQIHHYLLGELPEAEQTAFEQELLDDRKKFDQVWATESGLVDNYVRGEMSRSDRERFEKHYMASQLHRERVAIAELFLQEIDGQDLVGRSKEVTGEVRQSPSAVSWWVRFFASLHRPQFAFATAMAMLLLVSCGIGWLFFERARLTEQLVKLQNEAQTERSSRQQREQELAQRAQDAQKENADRRQENDRLNAELEQFRRSRAEQPVPLSFLLTPAPIRGQNTAPLQLPLVRSPIQLLMELNGNHYPSYRFRLQTVEGREIFSQSSGPGSSKERVFAIMTVPAGKLVKGDYVLILSGQTAGGAIEEIDQYFFQVK